jgi:malonyl-CoA O-methyltransferase
MCSRPAARWRPCSIGETEAVPEPGIDARAARRRFERAARGYAGAARLEAEVAARMLERLDYMRLEPRRILDAGSGPPQPLFRRRYPKAEVIALDFALGMLRARKRRLFERNAPRAVCADLVRLPFAAGTVQLAWANMALHWVADPLAALRELHRVLAVDGLLLLSTLGPDTLLELGAAAGEARVHRFADMHDIGDLLLAAGFADPVVDAERLTLLYPDEGALLADLRASGQTSARADRPRGLAGRGFRRALTERLRAQRRDDKLGITFEVVYGHAWKAQPRRKSNEDAEGRAIVQFQRRR